MISEDSFAARLDLPLRIFFFNVELQYRLGFRLHGPPRDVSRYIDAIMEAA